MENISIKKFTDEEAEEIIQKFLHLTYQKDPEYNSDDADFNYNNFQVVRVKVSGGADFAIGTYSKGTTRDNAIPYTLYLEDPGIGIIFGKYKYVLFDKTNIECRNTKEDFEKLLNYVFNGRASSLIMKLDACDA